MRFEKLSPKQAEVFKFPFENYDALICDGAVRSGKTMMMIYAFVWWAMEEFNGAIFAVCGKTVQSAERNIIHPLLETKSITDKYAITYTRSMKLLTIRRGDKINFFYIFGGKDESSYMLIQGLTLSGVLLDEVALMPQSFVEQAITRTLSVDNSKLWFNCNPESPMHWFYVEWIQKAEEHNAKHLHFLMDDNPGLSKKSLEKAKRDFTGVFYNRYVLGEWVQAHGLVYDMFDPLLHVVPAVPLVDGKPTPRKYTKYYVSCDYGTKNATTFLLWGYCGGVWYCIKEYYYSGRDEHRQKTDEEFADDLQTFIADTPILSIVIDPSAASFIAALQKRQLPTRQANNAVIDGIRLTASCLQSGAIKICDCCKNLIKEFGLYVWDEKAPEDKPVKANDHALDAFRYFVFYVLNTANQWVFVEKYR